MHYITVIFLGVALAGTSVTAAPTDFPNRPIRIVVPFPPGGDIDPVARSLGERLQKAWGQPVVVENRAGGGAIIGTDYVAKSDPNGYTLLLCSVGAMTVNPHLYSDLPYNIERDIAPVSLIATTPMVLVANDTLPVKTVEQLVEYAKAKPGDVSFASAGGGNITHLTAVYFSHLSDTQMMHVPYKGSGPAIIDLLGGHVNVYFNPLPSALGYLRDGKAKALAVTSKTRSPSLPDTPTLHESGYEDFDVNSWYGVCAPKGTPSDVIAKLNSGVVAAIKSEEFGSRLLSLGTVPTPTSPEKFGDMIRLESARWAKLVREQDIKLN